MISCAIRYTTYKIKAIKYCKHFQDNNKSQEIIHDFELVYTKVTLETCDKIPLRNNYTISIEGEGELFYPTVSSAEPFYRKPAERF